MAKRPPEEFYDVFDPEGEWLGIMPLSRMKSLQAQDMQFMYRLEDDAIVATDLHDRGDAFRKVILAGSRSALNTDAAHEAFSKAVRISTYNRINEELRRIESAEQRRVLNIPDWYEPGEDICLTFDVRERFYGWLSEGILMQALESVEYAKNEVRRNVSGGQTVFEIDALTERTREWLLNRSKVLVYAAARVREWSYDQRDNALSDIETALSSMALPKPTKDPRRPVSRTKKGRSQWKATFDDRGRFVGWLTPDVIRRTVRSNRAVRIETDGTSYFVTHHESRSLVALKLLEASKAGLAKSQRARLWRNEVLPDVRRALDAVRLERELIRSVPQDPNSRLARAMGSGAPPKVQSIYGESQSGPRGLRRTARGEAPSAPAAANATAQAPIPATRKGDDARRPAGPSDAQIIDELVPEGPIRDFVRKSLSDARHGNAGYLERALHWAQATDATLDIYVRGAVGLITSTREGFNVDAVRTCVNALRDYAEAKVLEQDETDSAGGQARHFMAAWCDRIMTAADQPLVARRFANAFLRGETRGSILIPDETLLADAMQTEGLESGMIDEMASILPPPYRAFVIRVSSVKGLYGLGVLQDDYGTGVSIIPIHDDDNSRGWEDDRLMPIYRRIAFVIMYLVNERAGTIYVDGETLADRPTVDHSVEFNERRPAIPSLYVGPRIVMLDSRRKSSSMNRAPCAVRGSWCKNKYGTKWYRRPHWRRGSGAKRGQLPKEVYEHNLRYRGR